MEDSAEEEPWPGASSSPDGPFAAACCAPGPLILYCCYMVVVDMDMAPESCGPRHHLTSVHFPHFFGAGIEPSTSTSPNRATPPPPAPSTFLLEHKRGKNKIPSVGLDFLLGSQLMKQRRASWRHHRSALPLLSLRPGRAWEDTAFGTLGKWFSFVRLIKRQLWPARSCRPLLRHL